MKPEDIFDYKMVLGAFGYAAINGLVPIGIIATIMLILAKIINIQ